MNTLELLTKLAEKIETGTDLLIFEMSRYYLITGLLRVTLLAVVTGFILRLLSSGIKVINLTSVNQQDRTDLIYKGLLRTFSVLVITGACVFAFSELDQVVKVAVAPHVFFVEKIKELKLKGQP